MKHTFNNRLLVGLALAFCLLLTGCSGEESKSGSVTNNGSATPAIPPVQPAPASFINKVWQVSKSNNVAPGQLYVFLSEGTLVIASSQGKPAFGSWKYAEGKLNMVEEGRPYQVDILKLSQNEFQIKLNNPGEPTDITFSLAESPLLK